MNKIDFILMWVPIIGIPWAMKADGHISDYKGARLADRVGIYQGACMVVCLVAYLIFAYQ